MVGMVADLVVGVIVGGAVVLGVKLIGKLWRKPAAAPPTKPT
jgi:hypothetical protein